MRKIIVLAGLVTATLLAACSPPAQSDADEKALRADAPAIAEQDADKEQPVLDAEGNELDAELADAVRAKMDEEKAAREGSSPDDASAPTDEGVVASDDET